MSPVADGMGAGRAGGMGFGAGDHRTLLADLMEGEAYSQLGPEEVKYDDQYNRWEITLGQPFLEC